MFKRFDKDTNQNSTPAKKRRLSISKSIPQVGAESKVESTKKKLTRNEDVWGDDFAQEDIEEMDFIASQACMHDNDTSTGSTSQLKEMNCLPSTSKKVANSCTNNLGAIYSRVNTPNFVYTQSFNYGETDKESNKDYINFEKTLLKKKDQNSTFQILKDTAISDNTRTKNLEIELEKLQSKQKKILNDFITKDGETAFLRHQLQQTQIRAEKEKLQSTQFIEEQANRHRLELNALCTEKDKLKTQMELQTFEIEKLLERCKLLESRNIKFVEPHTANISSPVPNRKNMTSTMRTPNIKSVRLKNSSMQVNFLNKSNFYLRTWTTYYPLFKIPELIFKSSLPEKSLVDIQITEKTGKRNLPILQEEKTFRIFENPDLVKPIVTIINNKKLSIEFILPGLIELERRESAEFNSDNCIFIINKLVSVTRELTLNATEVLKTISQAMKNDDIRDMNDLYFSDIYKNTISYIKSIYDPNTWHKGERGIEVRRMFGILSCISMESFYLSEYIAGKTSLLTDRDIYYKQYSQKMIRYNIWKDKQLEFEMLNIILQFVSLLGYIRRAHQFSGLISAIIETLCNVEKKVGFCDKGIDYVFRIFKELVFSRPLSLCFVSLTKMMATFIKYTRFVQSLHIEPHTMALSNWKGALYFTTDACLLQILMIQMENFNFDFVTTIHITHMLLTFTQLAMHANNLLRIENSKSCNCSMKLLRSTIKMLCRSSEISLNTLQTEGTSIVISEKNICKSYTYFTDLKKYNIKEYIEQLYPECHSNKTYWTKLKKKQLLVLREGIKFLRHLATCDPDFIIRLSDIEDSFNLFMQNISTINNLVLHENEQEALNLIKSTFVFDKPLQTETNKSKNKVDLSRLSITTNFEKRYINLISRKESKDTYKEECSRNMFIAFKNLYNSKTNYE